MISKTEKVLLATIAICCFLTFDLTYQSNSSTLYEYLKILNNAEFRFLADVQAWSYLTMIVGFLVSIFILDFFEQKKQLLMGILGIVIMLITAFLPINTSPIIYKILLMTCGFILPFLTVIPNVWLVNILSESNYKLYIQLMHFLQSLNFLYPQFVIYYFIHENDYKDERYDYFNLNLNKFNHFNISLLNPTNSLINEFRSNSTGLFDGIKRSNLWIPNLIISILQLLICFILIVSYFIEPYKKQIDQEKKDDIYRKAKKNLTTRYSIVFVSLLCLVIIFLASNFNVIYFQAIQKLFESDRKSDVAVYLSIILTFSTIGGRLLNVFLNIFLSSQIILFINFGFMIISNLLILIKGNQTVTMIYAILAFSNIGYSNFLPSFASLLEQRLSLTNKKMSIIYLTYDVSQIILFLLFPLMKYYPILIPIGSISLSYMFFLILLILEKYRLSKVN